MLIPPLVHPLSSYRIPYHTVPHIRVRPFVLSDLDPPALQVFVALEITLESIERMMEPPSLSTDGLLLVSILGLVVNVIGLLCCHEAHDHGHHDHGHGSDSDEDCCDDEIHDHNMRAIFLHILADTLGSVSVIVSVLCIKYLGWNWADPVASFFISVCTMASVVPLIGQSASVLLLNTPKSKSKALAGCAQRVLHLPGAVALIRTSFWCNTPGELCGAVQLGAEPGVDKQALAGQVRDVYERLRLSHLAVEVCNVRGSRAAVEEWHSIIPIHDMPPIKDRRRP